MSAKKCLVVLFALTSLFVGAIQPAFCDSLPRLTFYRYIKDLYYATKLPQVAQYWYKTSRLPMMQTNGTRAAEELKRLKIGYVYKPKITIEFIEGDRCTMKGQGIVVDRGRQIPCTLDVVMIKEDEVWKVLYYTWRAEVIRTN
ncbi:hypothetical protein KA344_09100 [bacterium]|jgi:hypothetical protein|nr:hypothetical protein [bacterium]